MSQTITYSQYVLTQDNTFIGRISSVLKDEGYIPEGSAVEEAARIAPDVAAQPGISEAYHTALIAEPPREDAGAADDVITDGMLLSAVAAVMAPDQAARSRALAALAQAVTAAKAGR